MLIVIFLKILTYLTIMKILNQDQLKIASDGVEPSSASTRDESPK